MQSKMSSFNKEIFLQINRSVGWIGIIYFMGLLFTVPFNILVTFGNEEFIFPRKIDSLFYFESGIQILLIIVIPVLLAVFLLRFLHVKQLADLIHSLPIKREKLFHHYVLTGMLYLVIPVIITSGIILIIHSANDLGYYFDLKDIGYWTGVTLVFNILFFLSGIFIGTLTGISAVQGVLTYILLIFPAGIFILLFYNLKFLFFGFPRDYFLNRDLDRMSPISHVSTLDHRKMEENYFYLYLLISILFYGISLFIYKKRRIEAVSQAIAFPKFKSIFKFGTTFCTMLLGGMYFGEVSQQGEIGWTFFGYGMGTIIGYFVAEMVLKKTWRVFGSYKGLVAYTGAIAIIVVTLQSFNSYEARVPALNKIKSVMITDSPMYANYMDPEANLIYSLKEKDSIQRVRDLHEMIISHKDKNINERYRQTASIVYELSNGDKMIRQYEVERGQFKAEFRAIYESEEFKRASNQIFKIEEENIKKLTVTAAGPVNKMVAITDDAKLKEAIKLLKQDVLQEPYEEMVNYSGHGSMIDITVMPNENVHLQLKPSYNHFEKWLDDQGLLQDATVTSDDISYILIAKRADVKFDYQSGSHEYLIEQIEALDNKVKITEAEKIDSMLDISLWDYEEEYIAIFYFSKQNYPEIRGIARENLPDFVEKNF